MPKIEMKKDAFLKKVKAYATNKKEKPTKLYITPSALSAVKVKFVFAKTDEITLRPQDLSFFKKSMIGRATPAKATDADTSKTYYFSFCAALLKELAAAKIYAGKNAREKEEALAVYLDTIRDGKIIFEVISKANLTIAQHEEEKESNLTVEENVSCSESFVENTSIEDVPIEGSGSEVGVKEEGNTPVKDVFQELFEESRRRIENQDSIIQGLESRVQGYETLVRKNELKIKETKTNAKENRLKAEKSELKVENLTQALRDLELENSQLKALYAEGVRALQAAQNNELKIRETRTKAKEERLKAEKSELRVENLTQTLHDLELENSQLKALHAEGVRALQAVQNREEEDRNREEEVEYGDEINDLLGELNDQKAETSLHLSEKIAQWNNRLHWSRSEKASIQIYNQKKNRNEKQSLARFIALAKLEEEKAAHFANDNKPWPKDTELAALQGDGYAIDLECFSLYQGLPEGLKKFAILFAFWEMAHHNRFYRSTLETVLNGGKVPNSLGMAENADITDVMLKLLHYADLTRILMGHYHYLARHQFDLSLFIDQAENAARYSSLKGKSIDVSRITTEAKFYQ